MNKLLTPRTQMILSWVVFVVALIGWPVSQLTVASSEPPFILGLSWFAIIWTAFGNIVSCGVNDEVSP